MLMPQMLKSRINHLLLWTDIDTPKI